MDFQTTKTKIKGKIKLDGKDPSLYPYAIQMYDKPPGDVINLQEFEQFAIERLQVLRIVEQVGLRTFKTNDEFRTTLLTELRKQGFYSYTHMTAIDGTLNESCYDDRRKDHISHFILRLAYCKTEELRRWFIQQEVNLFRYRFNNENSETIKGFLKKYDFNFESLSKEEKKRLESKIIASTHSMTAAQLGGREIFKIPFTSSLELVRTRKVYLEKGYAYVIFDDIVSIVCGIFRIRLSQGMAAMARIIPQLEEDSRLLKLLTGLNVRYFGNSFTGKSATSGVVSIERIDELAKSSFPPCMKNLHHAFRQNHHLKHGGRQQYGLFLKGIGIPLEESMKFWKSEFMKKMDGDQFDKKYAYNIRHNYGKEGKRTNYTPYSCMKIIMENAPTVGDHHGCPFRHSEMTILRQNLQNCSISQTGLEEVMDLATKGHCQLACTKYFETVHPKASLNQAISHPNHYFEESMIARNEIERDSAKFTSKNAPQVPRNPAASNVNVAAKSQTDHDDFMSDDFDSYLVEAEKSMNEG